MKFFIFSSVLGLVAAILTPPYQLSEDTVNYVAMKMKPSVDIFTPCNADIMAGCQRNFNLALGLDPTLNYLNGTYILNAINQLTATNVTQLVTICNQRTAFYQCFDTSYYSCMYLFNVLQMPGADYQNSFDYVRTYMGLDFLCNAGFEEAAADWSCLHGISTLNDAKACLTNFNETVTPAVLCPAVSTAGQCLNDVYKRCPTELAAGFFGCEQFRFTFDQVCYGLRCVVG